MPIPDAAPSPFPYFREIPPIPQWSARLDVDMPFEDFKAAAIAVSAATEHRFAGTLDIDPANGYVTSFVHTRFPRYKYGKPFTTAQCAAAMVRLGELFDAGPLPEFHEPDMSRSVLGLYEGQHATGTRTGPVHHSVADIASELGRNFSATPGQVFVLRAAPEAVYYTEEIAIITYPTDLKYLLYNLADHLKQERFSVESFGPRGQSYMVETRYCKDPDPPRAEPPDIP